MKARAKHLIQLFLAFIGSVVALLGPKLTWLFVSNLPLTLTVRDVFTAVAVVLLLWLCALAASYLRRRLSPRAGAEVSIWLSLAVACLVVLVWKHWLPTVWEALAWLALAVAARCLVWLYGLGVSYLRRRFSPRARAEVYFWLWLALAYLVVLVWSRRLPTSQEALAGLALAVAAWLLFEGTWYLWRRFNQLIDEVLLRDLPLPVTLALRYVRSTRRDAFASFLSTVAAGGIALGVMALVLSLAVISGFQEALRGELLGRTPQVLVDLPPGLGLAAAQAAREAVRRMPGVTGAQLQVRGNGWVVEQGKAHAVELVGFEGRVPRSFPGAAGGPEGLYVPASLAARWGLVPGRPLSLLSPRPTLTPLGPQPRLRTVPLAGTYRSGRTQEDRERVALPRAVAETLLGGSERQIEVAAADLDAALEVAARLGRRGRSSGAAASGGLAGTAASAALAPLPPGSEVRTWQELNRPLLFALRLEKVMMFVAVSLIVLVASLALVADLALIISSKRPEVGMLATMGATPAALRQAFVLLGGLVAGSGIALGTVIGVGGAMVLDRYHLVPVPGRVYFLDYVPFLVKPLDLALVLVITLALALASALYAAQRAATLDPIDALRR